MTIDCEFHLQPHTFQHGTRNLLINRIIFCQQTIPCKSFSSNALRFNCTAGLERLFILEHSDPRHQFSVRSDIRLPYNLELNSDFYYTDNLAGRNIQTQARIDLKFGMDPSCKLKLAVVKQKITNKTHHEFDSTDGASHRKYRKAFMAE